MYSSTSLFIKNTKSIITLYHGSQNENFTPTFGLGNDRHDYGKGFYLTDNLELAKEWAVANPNQKSGWVHKYSLDTTDLSIFDFQNENILSWLAELMKNRSVDNSKRYKLLSEKFISKYGIDTSKFDIIKGWRADASYFFIAKSFVRDEIDLDILEDLLMMGGLGVQYCLKTEKAYRSLSEHIKDKIAVEFTEYNTNYNTRDINARTKMKDLVNSDKNKLEKVFSTLI